MLEAEPIVQTAPSTIPDVIFTVCLVLLDAPFVNTIPETFFGTLNEYTFVPEIAVISVPGQLVSPLPQ